jgi:uncharacterized protein (DUF342 family)
MGSLEGCVHFITRIHQVNIPLSDARPGMTLCADISISGAEPLYAAGTVLSDTDIAALGKRGIQSIEIDSPAPARSPGDNAPPAVTVDIVDDGMQADLRIEPAPGAAGDLGARELEEALLAAGVVHGVKQDRLAEAVARWRRERAALCIEGAALGDAAVPGREGGYALSVQALTEREHIDIAREATHCWQLLERTGMRPQRVRPGDIIARRQPGTPPRPGVKVTGEEFRAETMIQAESNLDTTVEALEDGAVRATVGGVACMDGNAIGVIELSFDAGVECVVAADRMKAELIIHPACEDGNPPTNKSIHRCIAEQHITHGVDEEAIEGILSDLAKGAYPDSPVVIARGSAPRDGANGSVRYYFNTESTLKPRENPDGSVDFKNVELVQAVSAGAKLAELVAPEEGTPGADILGTVLPCKHGNPAVLPAGANTEISPSDPATLLSAIDGNIRFDGKNVEVCEGFIINGDVDYSTGNINYEKSVVVSGDVKAGFEITCGGDLEVAGTIEECRIEAGGHVLCKHGFIGQSRGVIDAKGDVNIGFTKNQEIRSRGNVSIAREALNSTIYARHAITISGHPLSAAGGLLFARDAITVHTVGNASGIKTVLEIGCDFSLLEEMHKTEASLEEMEENSRKLKKTADQFTARLRMQRKLPPKDEQLYAKLRKTLARYLEEIAALKQRQELIRQKLYNLDEACIHIEHAAETGTVFKIGERQHLLREPVIGPKTVRMHKHEIKVA